MKRWKLFLVVFFMFMFCALALPAAFRSVTVAQDPPLNWYNMSAPSNPISGNPTDQHGFDVVHSTNIVQCNATIDGGNQTYLAYDSDDEGNSIYLYYSNSTTGTWTPYSANPILSSAGSFRTPSIAYTSGFFEMFLNNITSKDVERWTSNDGVTFTRSETILTTTDDPWTNPFVWLNPNDGYWYLFWVDGNNTLGTWTIYSRNSSSITALALATDITVMSATSSTLPNLSFPTIMYRNSHYWLLCEAYPSATWEIIAFVSTSVTSGYAQCPNSPILTNDEACPKVFISDDGASCYLFTDQNSTFLYQEERSVHGDYYLTVDTSPSGVNSPTGEGWYDSGSSAPISTDHYVDIVPGSRYSFTEWTGDPEISSSSSSSTTVTMDADKTVTANYVTQYYIAITSDHGNPNASSQWVDASASFSVSVTNPDVVTPNEHQWNLTGLIVDGVSQPLANFASFSGVATNHTVEFDWQENFYLIVNSAHDTPEGASWYTSGATAYATLVDGTVSGGSGTQYVFAGWSGDASGFGLTSNEITMDNSKTATATWTTQYNVTFAQSGVGVDFSGNVINVIDVNYTRSGYSDWFDSGASVSFGFYSPLVVTLNGEQYVLTGVIGNSTASPLTISAPATITGTYKTQYYLTVDSAYGTPGGEDWYDNESTAYATVTPLTVAGSPGTQHVFNTWSDDASGSTSPSNAITMDGPKIATATWTTQYNVTFDVSGLDGTATGTVLRTNSSSTTTFLTYTDFPYSAWVNSSDQVNYFYYVTVLSTVSNQRFRFDVDNGTFPLIISGPTTVFGEYSFQYNVTFAQTGVASDFTGDVVNVSSVNYTRTGFSAWFDTGATVPFNYYSSLVVTPNGEQYVLTSVSGNTTDSSLAVSAAANVTGSYKTQWYITVSSTHDSPTPSAWIDSGASFDTFVTSPTEIVAGDHQWVCTGYSIDSGASTLGTEYNFTSVSAAHTISFSWKEQFWIVFGQSGVGSDFTGTVVTVNSTYYDRFGTSFWANSGDLYNFSFSSPLVVTVNVKQYVLAGANESSPFIVSASETVTGTYTIQWYVTFTQTGLDGTATGTIVTINGSAIAYLGLPNNTWVNNGDTVNYTYPSTVPSSTLGEQFRLNSVTGFASPITVTSAVTVTGNYVTQYNVTFTQNGVSTDFAGVIMNVSALNYTRTGFSGWFDSGAVVSFNYYSPLVVTPNGKQYVLTAANATSPLTVSTSETITGTYITQWYVTFNQSGLDGSALGTIVNVNFTAKNYSSLPYSLWVNNSDLITYNYIAIVSSSVSGKQFRLGSTTGLTSPITVTTSGMVTGNYVIQYNVTFGETGVGFDFSGTVVTVNGTGYNRNGTSFWADSGNIYNFSYASSLTVTLNVKQYAWISTSGLSSLQSSFLTVSTNGSIIGNYLTQYNVTFAQSGLDGTATGTVVTVNGSAESFASLPFSTWVNSSDSIDYTYTAIVSSSVSGKRFSFSSATGPTSPINVTSAVTVTAHYAIQYNLIFGQSGAGSDFTGTVMTVNGTGYNRLGVSIWASSGDVYNFTYGTPLTVNAGEQYMRTSVNASSPLTVSAGTTVTGSYVAQYLVTFYQDGLDATANGTVVTVNSTAINYTGLPYNVWVNGSNTLVFNYANVSSTASDMWFVVYSVSANSPLTVTGSTTITGYYKTELLTMQLKATKGWYWTQDTTVTSAVTGDLYGNGVVEIVTGGYYFDGVRDVAQLVIWNGSNRAVLGVTVWYWYGNTTINSVAIGDVYGNGSMEIVTGGSYFDGTRNVAQLVVWDASTLAVRQVKVWTWVSDTTINSVAISDVYGDGHVEIVTGGYYFDNTRDVAQLVIWNGSTLSVNQVKVWTWGGNTTINSLAVGDVDADGQKEIVTGGYYFDGTRDAAQLVVWNSTLAVKQTKVWSWGGNTAINSVAIGNVYGNGSMRIVTGGYYFDGTRNVAQLVIWNGSNMAIDEIRVWYWFGDTTIHSVAIGDVDQDGRTEIVTGGSYFDGVRNVSQLVVWDTSALTVKQVAVWSAGGNTVINCVIVGGVNEDGVTEIVTGGSYYDGTRIIAQLTVWSLTYS